MGSKFIKAPTPSYSDIIAQNNIWDHIFCQLQYKTIYGTMLSRGKVNGANAQGMDFSFLSLSWFHFGSMMSFQVEECLIYRLCGTEHIVRVPSSALD